MQRFKGNFGVRRDLYSVAEESREKAEGGV